MLFLVGLRRYEDEPDNLMLHLPSQNHLNITAIMELFVKMTISAWDTQNARLNKLMNSLTDEQMAAETSPGRNTGTYLFGHLIAVSDALFPIMGWGERLYPELETIF